MERLMKLIVNLILQSCFVIFFNKQLTYCFAFSADMLHQVYPELLKRMDDSSDEIRIVVTRTFLAYFK